MRRRRRSPLKQWCHSEPTRVSIPRAGKQLFFQAGAGKAREVGGPSRASVARDAQVLKDGSTWASSAVIVIRAQLQAPAPQAGNAVKSVGPTWSDDAGEGCQQRGLADAGRSDDLPGGSGAQRERDSGGGGAARPATPNARFDDAPPCGISWVGAGFLPLKSAQIRSGCLRTDEPVARTGGQFRRCPEGRQRTRTRRPEHLGQDTDVALRDADEECTDDGCTYRAHVEGTPGLTASPSG